MYQVYQTMMKRKALQSLNGEKIFMASRKSSLASENYKFTSHKPTGSISKSQARTDVTRESHVSATG